MQRNVFMNGKTAPLYNVYSLKWKIAKEIF